MKQSTGDTISESTVKHIAHLARIPLKEAEIKTLARGFAETLAVVARINSVDTKQISAMHAVHGTVNVFREDVVDKPRMFSQKQALSNAKRTHKGYFVVDRVLDGE